MADTNDVKLSYAAEVTPDLNPAGAFTDIPWTSETLKAQANTSQSGIVRSDGNITDIIRNSLVPQNGFSGELGFGYYDDFIEGAFRNNWTTPDTVAAITLSITGAGPFTLDDSGSGLGVFEVFDIVHAKGFATAANNGVYLVTTVAAGSLGVVAIETNRTPVVEAAGASVSVTTDRMANAQVDNTFHIEKRMQGTALEYMFFGNMRVNTMSLEIVAESPITTSFDFIGESHGTTKPSASYTAAPANDPMNTDNHFKGVGQGSGADGLTGLATADSCVTRVTMQIQNAVRRDAALNCVEMGKGRFQMLLDWDAYFKTMSDYDRYVNDENASCGCSY